MHRITVAGDVPYGIDGSAADELTAADPPGPAGVAGWRP